MAKSGASCLRIIACGSDSVNEDGQTLPQSKSSSGRREWSFWKRSARRKVLSNSVVSEVPPSTNNESLESTTASDSQVQRNLTFPDKTSAVQTTQEKNELPAYIDSTSSKRISVRGEDSKAVVNIDGASIMIIQTAIRGYLAQQALVKQRHTIKLQAAVRGHLVRRHAAGTLRCIQAIIKMQTLVRQRRTCLREEGSGTSEKQNGDGRKRALKPMILRSREVANVPCTYTSLEKLLSNKFARQLMESRTQPINIKCEPLKSDSAWKWLERWMSVSSEINGEPAHEHGSAGQNHEKEDSEHSEGKGNILVQTGEASENNDLIANDSDMFDLHAFSSISPSPSNSKLQNIDGVDSGYDVTQPADPAGVKETVLISRADMKSLPHNEDAGNKQFMPETEPEKYSTKTSNPTLVSAPSVHEELNSVSTSSNLTTLHSPGVQPGLTSVSTGPPFGSREIGLIDASISNNSAIQVARSECGTELSISSTLDSSDRSDSGGNALERESEKLDVTGHPEANDNSHILGTELSYPNMIESESCQGVESVSGECVNPVAAAESLQLEKKLEFDQNNVQGDQESDVSQLAHKPSPSPAVSPFRESQATAPTPSGEKREAKRKNKRRLSSASSIHNSPSRSSLEKLPRGHKTGRRRSSIGSAKPDHVHQEPRNSCNSDSVPSYMQATESARAKAIISNGSPKSGRDVHAKNRGSLSTTNARQGSSRVHLSLSLAKQNVKASGANSPQGTTV